MARRREPTHRQRAVEGRQVGKGEAGDTPTPQRGLEAVMRAGTDVDREAAAEALTLQRIEAGDRIQCRAVAEQRFGPFHIAESAAFADPVGVHAQRGEAEFRKAAC